VNHIVMHLAICKASDIVLGYCKKLALRFCEKVAKEITDPILAPVERFIETVFMVSLYSLAVAALIVFTSAIPRRAA
jgi:hypothetical protein